MKDRRAKFLETVPESCRGIVARAFEGNASPRQAIKAHCLTCTGFDRSEISLCRVVLCPLHGFRPYQKEGDE